MILMKWTNLLNHNQNYTNLLNNNRMQLCYLGTQWLDLSLVGDYFKTKHFRWQTTVFHDELIIVEINVKDCIYELLLSFENKTKMFPFSKV